MKYSASCILFFAFLAQALGQSLVMLGGNLKDDNTAVWKKIVALGGGTASSFGVLSVSTKDTAEGLKVIANLKSNGAASVVPILINKKTAKTAPLAIAALTGIFIVEDTDVAPPKAGKAAVQDSIAALMFRAGFYAPPAPPAITGVVATDPLPYKRQNLINNLLVKGLDGPVLTAIKIVMAKTNGVVVVNGAVVPGKLPIILDGDSVSAVVLGSRLFYSYPRTPVLFDIKSGGLNLLNSPYVVDTRLSEAGREVRLMRVLLESGRTRGLGIDENTALIVTTPLTSPTGTVLSAANTSTGVFTLDLNGNMNWAISDAKYTNLKFDFSTVGDTLNLASGAVTYPTWKTAITTNLNVTTNSTDILSLMHPGEWRAAANSTARQVSQKLVNNYSGPSMMPIQPKIMVTFNRTDATSFKGKSPSNDTGIFDVTSYKNMLANIVTIGIPIPVM